MLMEYLLPSEFGSFYCIHFYSYFWVFFGGKLRVVEYEKESSSFSKTPLNIDCFECVGLIS